jgi:cytochrome c1
MSLRRAFIRLTLAASALALPQITTCVTSQAQTAPPVPPKNEAAPASPQAPAAAPKAQEVPTPPKGESTPSPAPKAVAKPAEFTFERQNWTFSGPFGYFDRQQLRRGYKIYKTICANCHSMNLMHYRNLGEPGGPEFPEAVVKEIAHEAQVTDGPDDKGAMYQRPGKPSDAFVAPFKNPEEAAAANNGAVPPDMSTLAKARTITGSSSWYLFPVELVRDVSTQYQEGGADYIYALLTSYSAPPADMKMTKGMNYNLAFPGHQIAMPQPLEDGTVEYDEDKTPNSLDQEARDVASFLTWASDPHLVARKQLGLWVIIYLIVVAGLLWLAKRTLWRDISH